MSGFRLFLFSLLVLGSVFSGSSQNVQRQLQDRIYQAFISGEPGLWEQTIGEIEHFQSGRKTPTVLYDLLLARYGFIAMKLDDGDNSLARHHLDKAQDELEQLKVYSAWQSRAYALEGALLGFRISLRPLSAIRLGPRSYSAIDKALELDPDNPAAWMEKANSRFYTPSTFGGSKEEAVRYYSNAIALFEKDLPANQRWLYLNSLVGLAKSYQYTGQAHLTVPTLEKALAFEPDFKWVKDELLPQYRNP